MSLLAGLVAARIGVSLGKANLIQPSGHEIINGSFLLPLQAGTACSPTIAFVGYARWPRDRPISAKALVWEVVPDLVAEVIDGNTLVESLMTKIKDYFTAGVRLVWVVYPNERMIYVYESATRIICLIETDELTGGAMLPHFRVRVGSLFPYASEPMATAKNVLPKIALDPTISDHDHSTVSPDIVGVPTFDPSALGSRCNFEMDTALTWTDSNTTMPTFEIDASCYDYALTDSTCDEKTPLSDYMDATN